MSSDNYTIQIHPPNNLKPKTQLNKLPRVPSMSVMETDKHQGDEILWNQQSSKKNHKQSPYKIDIAEVFRTQKLFAQTQTIVSTPLSKNTLLSQEYEAEIYLKREEQQRGRTYKIRGSYYYYLTADQETRNKGIVIVSDGNFATATSIISGMHHMKCVIFVPHLCYQHKIDFMKKHGGDYVEVIQTGKDFQECIVEAKKYSQKHGIVLVQPNSNEKLLIGYATMGNQIINDNKGHNFDIILVPTGGGALVCSLASYFKQVSPQTKIIGVEPQICTPFSRSIIGGKIVESQKASVFCSGSSVKTVSENMVEMGKTCVDGFVSVSQFKVSQKMIKLYSMGIISQPSGALGIAGLDKIRNLIKGKKVLCLLSGANMDISRFNEAREMSARSKGYKSFYLINLPNKKNAVYDLIVKCFKKTDKISIQYSKNLHKNSTQTLLSVESLHQDDVEEFICKMNQMQVPYENITERDELIELFS